MPPGKVADAVFDAIQKEQFYILSHPEWMELVQLRTDKLIKLENPENPLPVVMRILAPQP